MKEFCRHCGDPIEPDGYGGVIHSKTQKYACHKGIDVAETSS